MSFHPLLAMAQPGAQNGGTNLVTTLILFGAIILVVVLVALVIGVTRFDLPGWILPAGLLGSAGLLRAWEKRASS